MKPLVTHIVRAPKGTARQVLPINEIVIPDLWHVAMGLNEIGKACSSEAVLITWHLAHDLLRTLRGEPDYQYTPEPAPDNVTGSCLCCGKTSARHLCSRCALWAQDVVIEADRSPVAMCVLTLNAMTAEFGTVWGEG